MQQPESSKMKHDFRDATSQKHANCGMVHRSIGENIDNARHLTIDVNPVLNRWTFYSRSVGDGRNVQQKIGRTAKGSMNCHGVMEGFFSQNLTYVNALTFQQDERAGRPARHIEPDQLT